MSRYAHRKFTHAKSGKELVCVFDTKTTLPALLPLIWVSLYRNKASTATQEADMTALAFFYEYLHRKRQISLEECWNENGIRGLVEDLPGFSSWLCAGRIGTSDDISYACHNNPSSRTHDQRINAVCRFLSFLNDRYASHRYLEGTAREIQRLHASQDNLINSTRRHLTHSLSQRKKAHGALSGSKGLVGYRSFNSTELDIILRIIQPSLPKNYNPLNPWRSYKIQIRNYIVVKLLSDYGLRKGELLLLQTHSFKPTRSGKHALVVTTPDETVDTRKYKPSIKTPSSHRTILISKGDYDLLTFYVSEIRNKPVAPDNTFLFTSDRNQPLNLRYPNTLCDNIFRVINKHFTEIIDASNADCMEKITPHMFRHTWAVQTLSFLVDSEQYSLEVAQDILRELGGWTSKSPMPAMYGRKFIADKGNAANLRRVSRKANIAIHDIEKMAG